MLIVVIKECARLSIYLWVVGDFFSQGCAPVAIDVLFVVRSNSIIEAGVIKHFLAICFPTKDNYSAISMVENGLEMSIMNELITKNFETKAVKIPLDPPKNIKLGIALPSLAKATPAAVKVIAYAKKVITSIR